MYVDRCECKNVTFEQMLQLHQEEGLGLSEIKERLDVCHECMRCEPFVRLTLATGRTEHPRAGIRAFAAARRLA